jgi:hypothetical protein
MSKKHTVNGLHLWEVETRASSRRGTSLWITTKTHDAACAARKTCQFERAIYGRIPAPQIKEIKYRGTLDV